MSNSLMWKIQKSLYNILGNDINLSALVSGVFTHVPQNASFPYVKMGSFVESELSNKAGKITKISFSLLAFSQKRSLEEILDIVSISKNLLDNPIVIIEDFSLVRIDHLKTEIDMLQDGVTWSAVLSFELILQGNES